MVESENALMESIKKKGDKSYYYAHAPRNIDIPEEAKVLEGVGIVTGGPPVLITKDAPAEAARQVTPQIVNIRNYSWAEDDDKVTLYINFEEEVKAELISCTFNTKEFALTYDFSEAETRKLILKNLTHNIDPSQSNYKIRKSRITVNLKKTEIEKWYKLTES
ncbi:unnamed protein product [Blepharisma stoltei]|uniref:CS domain-containing protein n=1 Tax=Blepharisma stoltei TaxID=1481888 RepID=A0AAU9JST5_9CILI|nr:unnamed protein product [Blepharisma stoltei]